MRERRNIDLGWKFHLGDSTKFIERAFDDAGWRLLDLPHDWSVEFTADPSNPAGADGGFFPGGIGWYRKILPVPADLGERRMLIEFDGVYMNSEVWCNGNFCGVRPYGYSSFCYDISPYVKPGENAVVAVRVDNSRQKNSRWYSGSGIYRHVWLTTASPLRVDHWGTYITTPEITADSARVECRTTIVNNLARDCDFRIISAILDSNGLELASFEQDAKIMAGQKTQVNSVIKLRNPQLWSPENPYLYTLRTTISSEGEVLDIYDSRCGIRNIRFDANEGFFLNGQPMKLKGVNEHHDAGCLGAAVHDDVIRRRIRILKDMGCNAIRSAHNPASPAFLDICDEMGIMIVEDAFDEWRDGKTPFGYQLYWDLWWERDLSDMIRRDRNHPCIILWSVGNEIKEVREGRADGLQIMRALRDVCHREDPTRPMTCGCCCSRETLSAGYGPLIDVFGYNGGGGGCFDYEKDHAKYPKMPMFASEHPHTLQTRGVYRTRSHYRDLARNPDHVKWYEPEIKNSELKILESKGKAYLELMRVDDLTDEEIFTQFDEHYRSSYGNAIVRMSIFDSWSRTRRLPFFCGEFRWTGFDYLGECYAWPAKSWNFGIIDLCGFPKDAYYFYQSQWSDKAMVHILPHWTWPGLEGKKIPVIAYSNCEKVELFIDGKSLGAKNMGGCMQQRWDVEYRPGAIKALGYRNGKVLAECSHETSSKPHALRILFEEKSIRADRSGIAHAVLTIVDDKGRLCPHANPDITVSIEGPAELIGLENGDPIDSTNYKINHRRAFNGMMLAIVRSKGEKGKIKFSASSEGLKTGNCQIEAV